MFFRQDTPLPTFLPLPHFVMAGTYSANAKLLYALLLGRTTLSQKNGWVSEEGHVYVIYTICELAEDLHCGERTVQSALNELERAKLITRVRRGRTRANHIFLCMPDEVQFCTHEDSKFCAVDSQKSAYHDLQNLPSSKNHKKQNDRKQNDRTKLSRLGEARQSNYDSEYVDKGDCL